MRAAEKSIVAVAIVILLIAFVHRLYTRGGPYLQGPETIVDHVGPDKHETRDALVLLPKIRRLLPRGAEVTCFRPIGGQTTFDMQNLFVAVGQLPDQRVQHPFLAAKDVPVSSLVEYVIAIREPFTHPMYRVVAQYPEGRLYKVAR